MSKANINKRIERMRVLESKIETTHHKLIQLKLEWQKIRDSELLESEEYRYYCESLGIDRHYTFGDLLA